MFNIGRNRLILLIILVNIICTFLAIFIITKHYYLKKIPFSTFYVAIIILSLIGLLSLFLYIQFIRHFENEKKIEFFEREIEELKNVNLLLREERHDVKNHYQVILGFIQLGKTELAEEYLKRIIKDTGTNLNKLEHLKAPESIKILLANNIALSEEKGIPFKIHIETQIEKYSLDYIDLVRILSNLLSNAFYAAAKDKNENSYVSLRIWEDKWLNIEVENTGRPIPDSLKKKIFKAGFTTKGEKGDGMGLYIVKNLIEKYNGKIILKRKENGNCFKIKFPNKLIKCS